MFQLCLWFIIIFFPLFSYFLVPLFSSVSFSFFLIFLFSFSFFLFFLFFLFFFFHFLFLFPFFLFFFLLFFCFHFLFSSVSFSCLLFSFLLFLFSFFFFSLLFLFELLLLLLLLLLHLNYWGLSTVPVTINTKNDTNVCLDYNVYFPEDVYMKGKTSVKDVFWIVLTSVDRKHTDWLLTVV